MKRRQFIVGAAAASSVAVAGCSKPEPSKDWVQTETTHEIEEKNGETVISVTTKLWKDEGMLDGCTISLAITLTVDGKDRVLVRDVQRDEYYYDYPIEYTATFHIEEFETITSRTDVMSVEY